MKRSALLVHFVGILALMAGLTVGSPAAAVTDGELDGDDHPGVVLLLMEVGGEPAFRCSATLLSATVVLTAGHCTNGFPGEPFTGMRIFVESDVDDGDNNYPLAGPNSYEAKRWAAHPKYETAPFFVHDVGVVVLKGRGVPTDVIDPSHYASLPKANQLDRLKTRRGHHKVWFTAVGYGLQRINPVFVESDRVRMVAHPRLIQINGGIVEDFSLLLSNNHSTGGTCFGDSGGPNFLRDSDVVAGVTSFGLNGNCAGTGGVFRMDRADVLRFVKRFL